MGLDENVAAARAMAACSDLLLLADGDTGYGNALNAYHTVRAFERAGVAGLMLEDQVWPKRCGHLKGKEVISAEEMVQKIRAAAEARVDPDFVIKSRTDVLATHASRKRSGGQPLMPKPAPTCCSPTRRCRPTTSARSRRT